jgi:hypothetical protein
MSQARQVLNSLLELVIKLGDLIVGAIIAIEIWLRGQLAMLGLPPLVQTVLLIACAALLILAALRLFGGLVRIAVILVLLLIALHILMPVLHA